MSISDKWDLYISYRKMQMIRRVRQKMEGKIFHSCQSRNFAFVDNIIKVLFLTFCLELACTQLCFPPMKCIKRRNESTMKEVLLVFLSTENKIQYSWFTTFYNSKLLKPKFIFLQKNENQVLLTDHYFSRRKWQFWGLGETLQHLTRRIVRSILGVT